MKTGFTLIELLVVVLIIGILSAVALPQYTKAVEKARAMEAVTQLKALGDAQKVYKLANGKYSENADELDISVPGVKNAGGTISGKHYVITFQYANTSGAQRMQAGRTGKNLWFVYYLESQAMNCQIGKSSAADSEERAVCKTFSPDGNTCTEEPGYDCYPVR